MKQVDFSNPTRRDLSEIVVAGPGADPIMSAQDLSGREVYVRKSSSFFQSIEQLNAEMVKAGKAPVKVRPAPDDLETEDILEMVNACLVNITIADEPMDTLNEALFTFASYNAGPGRIAQLRQLAVRRGLDPNIWFSNVEVVASEKIGRETVQCISNIYKYDLAYQMIEEQRAEHEKAKEAAKKE